MDPLCPELEAKLTKELEELRVAQKKQGEAVKALKTAKAEKKEIQAAVAVLNKIKTDVAAVLKQLYPPEKYEVNRTGLEELLKRRFFVSPAFSIYGGSAGLYDYGPPGCAVKSNLLDFWRQFFVLEENMLQVDTTCLTPSRVLEVSGHVEKFQDVMVKDEVTGAALRADHLVEDYLEEQIQKESTPDDLRQGMRADKTEAGDASPDVLEALIKKYKIKSPEGNAVSAPFYFNLMFGTQLGPHAQAKAFLRPETAQGMFVNFKALLDANYGKLPFASACIGLAFRNEIAPRNGLLRVREFCLAEIEHFLFPDEKEHDKFPSVENIELHMLTSISQEEGDGRMIKCTLKEAVEKGFVKNTTMGYFIGRTALFFIAIGIKKFRFRQHKEKEMAHYAQDCWDAEILSSNGWIECVGIADRACYDLNCHGNATGCKMGVFREFKDGQRTVTRVEASLNKGQLGKTLKKESKKIFAHFATLDSDALSGLDAEMKANGQIVVNCEGKDFTLTPDSVTFKTVEKRESGESIVPSVIEPAFGIGRIIHCIFEHAYQVRPDDEQRGYLSFTPLIAPVKCSVLPLVSGTPELEEFVADIARRLTDANITNKVDSVSHTIGRRYARTDEIGIPFGITVDFDTPPTQTVTLRDRDSTRQVRIPIAELCEVLDSLVRMRRTWADVEQNYPAFTANTTE